MSSQDKSMQDVRRLTGAALSMKARVGYVALLLVSASMAGVCASLWMTEPGLPLRTQLAFGVMTLIGAAWVVLSVWVLATRRVLFARDRVIAGRMAVAFSAVFLVGTAVAVWLTGSTAAHGALATAAAMLACALYVLAAARRRFAELSARRAALAEGSA